MKYLNNRKNDAAWTGSMKFMKMTSLMILVLRINKDKSTVD